ncbi:Hypothetical predicted protein [Scomber scombrus]|uniref:Uncharacterized protein n=1 Tax=Scomber scombrus TaxID=13677 RepID=A0AAV1PVW0_SCOSC
MAGGLVEKAPRSSSAPSIWPKISQLAPSGQRVVLVMFWTEGVHYLFHWWSIRVLPNAFHPECTQAHRLSSLTTGRRSEDELTDAMKKLYKHQNGKDRA